MTPAVLTRFYDPVVKGRLVGLQLGDAYIVGGWLRTNYGPYAECIVTVNGFSDMVVYSRLNQSDLLAGYTTQSRFSATYTYELNRDMAHAIARNERRTLFPLTSIVAAYGGYSYGVPNEYEPSDFRVSRGDRYWEQPFSGAHSDVGGEYDDGGSNLDALWWMYGVWRE